jgi:hypothetical protein
VRAYGYDRRLDRGILESDRCRSAQVTWYTDDEEHVMEWVAPPNVVAATG